MANRPVRAEGVGCWGCGADGARMGPLRSRRHRLDPVPDLRALLRHRDRHCLCRRGLPDGEVVSGPAGVCHRDRRGRLRNGRHADDISHFIDALLPRRAGDVNRVRRHSRQRRRSRRARPTRAAGGRSGGPRRHARARERRRAGQYAEDADLLANVRHDDDDVDRRG